MVLGATVVASHPFTLHALVSTSSMCAAHGRLTVIELIAEVLAQMITPI